MRTGQIANLMGAKLMPHEKELIQAVLSLLDHKNDGSLDEELIVLIKERKKESERIPLSSRVRRIQKLADYAGVANDEL
tara:strand:- start:678 stop:914 length:237 start_codon:yes stop_codon:yes gene_type:complete